MKSNGTTGRLAWAGGLAALLLFGACAKEPDDRAKARAPAEQTTSALPPAIIPPSDASDTPSPPSFEVGIATAAANRNRAKEKCAEKSERVRAMCEADADAAFASAQAGIEDLRGNQQ